MHEPAALSPESHTHAQGGWKKGGLRRRAWEGKEISSDSRKMFRDFHKGTAVRFSPLDVHQIIQNLILTQTLKWSAEILKKLSKRIKISLVFYF